MTYDTANYTTTRRMLSDNFFFAAHLSTDARRAVRLAGLATVNEFKPHGTGFIARSRGGIEVTVTAELLEEAATYMRDTQPARVR